eukprot:scaffold27152_cov85-Cyclotella_meneghiniana.AAC.1
MTASHQLGTPKMPPPAAEGTNLSHELKQQSSQRRGTAGAACSLQSEETRNQSRSGNRTTSTAGVPKQQFTRSRSNNWTASTARGLPEATIYQKQRRSGGCPCPVVRGDSRPEPEAKQQSSNEHHNDVSPLLCDSLIHETPRGTKRKNVMARQRPERGANGPDGRRSNNQLVEDEATRTNRESCRTTYGR